MPHDRSQRENPNLDRRTFLLTSAAAAAAPLVTSTAAGADAPRRKIKIGAVGCGGRGGWIAGLFQQHGGYDLHAVADYFPHVANACGDKLGVDKSRRFSGLSGYKRVIESGVEAIVLEVPPHFFPEQAKAAAEAGLHVYMAKPVAADVPGCLTIEAAARDAAAKKRCFLVDYQMPTDPINIEVRKRIAEGALGKLAYLCTFGVGGGFNDPPKGKTIEDRLQGLVWVNDIALGCDYIGNFDIHALDAALWVVGGRPLWAAGSSRVGRPNAHGDSRGVCSVVYEFDGGVVLNHTGQGLPNNTDGALTCQVFGESANAQINYWGKAFVRGGPKHYGGGNVDNLYEAGAKRNIAEFHQWVSEGRIEHPSAKRAVDGCLTAILGREAAARHGRLTMDELLKENKRLEVDLTGLKV